MLSENDDTLNVSLLSKNCNVDICPEKNIRTSISTNKDDGTVNIDVDNNSCLYECIH